MMGMRSHITKESAFRARSGAANNPPKTLLTLYRRKGLDIARAGHPSPLAGMSAGQAAS